MTKDIDVNN